MSINGTKVLALNSAGSGLAPLKVDSNGLLRVIAEATSVSANAINLNTDGLEALGTANNTKLDTLIGHNDGVEASLTAITGYVDGLETLQTATNSALATIDGVLDNAEAHLGNIDTGVDVLEACVGSNKVNVNISSGNITGFALETTASAAEVHLGSIDGKLSTLETDVEATNSALATIDGVLDNAEAHLGNIDTGIDVLEACVGSNKMNVNISSGNISGFATQSTLADAETHLGNIDTGVDVLEACVGSNKVNVNISSGNITGFATQTTLADAETHLGSIDGKLSTLETDVEATNTLLTTIDGVLDNAEAHLGNIDTGVDVLEACVGSNKVNVNISSGNISGFATESTLGDAEAHLGNIETSVQALDDIVKAEDTAHSSGDKGVMMMVVRQDSQADFGADGDYVPLSVDANGLLRVSGGATDVSALSTHAKQDTIIGHLDGVEGKLDHLSDNLDTLETTNNACQVLLGTIDSDTDAIKTDMAAIEVLITAGNGKLDEIEGAVETVEACVSSNKMKTLNTQDVSEGVWINNAAVNSTSFSASLETTGYSKLRLYGVVDSDFSGAPPNVITTGSLTNGGTYTPLEVSTDGITTQTSYISGGSVIGVNATIDNPPKFIKLYNLHGSTNFTFTLNYSLSN